MSVCWIFKQEERIENIYLYSYCRYDYTDAYYNSRALDGRIQYFYDSGATVTQPCFFDRELDEVYQFIEKKDGEKFISCTVSTLLAFQEVVKQDFPKVAKVIFDYKPLSKNTDIKVYSR